jgi:hypothetical protein
VAQLSRAARDLGDPRGVVAPLDAFGRFHEGIERWSDATRQADPEQDGRPAGHEDHDDRCACEVGQCPVAGDEPEQRPDDP